MSMHGRSTLYCYQSLELKNFKFGNGRDNSRQNPKFPGQHRQFQVFYTTHKIAGFLVPVWV